VRIPLLGLCAGLAVAAKAGGVMLAPGVGFVLVVSCWRVSARLSVRAMWLIGAVVLAGAVLSAAAHWRNLELGRGVGGAFSLDPLSWSMNLLGLLLSLNKGLVVYAPLVLLALVGFRHAWRRQPQLTVFAAVSLAGLAGGLALFYFWAEETWGPRYLHSAVAGLMLVAAVGTARRWRRHRFAFVSLAVVGAIVSLLGCLFHYGVLFHTARPLTPLTTERLQGDATLNPVIFHLRLVVAVWQRSWHPESSVPYPWSARGHRWFPKDGQRGFPRDGDGTPSTADLRDIAHLQPEVIKVFASPSSHAIWILRSFYSCLLLGTLATGLALWRLCLNDARVPR
jgi:hypothetical protein